MARDLSPRQPPVGQAPAAASSSGTGSGAGSAVASSAAQATIGAYCEICFGQSVLRTPIVQGQVNPVFNWSFDLPLSAELGSPDLPSDRLTVKVSGRAWPSEVPPVVCLSA